MLEILTAAQSKLADATAIAGGLSGIRMMEAAGAAVAHEITENFDPCPVLVLCGPGNNGGDGFVIARLLRAAEWPVRVACLAKKSDLKHEAALAAKEWDGNVEELNSSTSMKDVALVVDAIFGTGYSGALDPEVTVLFDKVRKKELPVIAVDVPSGVNATDATVAEGALAADMTITFCRKKIAHTLLPAKETCGRTIVASIGVTDETITLIHPTVFENHPALWANSYPIPQVAQHKYDRGHVCVLGGAKRTGAARLAAGAAQRIGAGLVTIASAPESAAIYASDRASIMVDTWDSADALRGILRDERKNVLLLGPGLGLESREAADTALSFGRKAVLDADIFTIYKSDSKQLLEKTSENTVLTPHEGEFARIFPDIAGSKVERAQKAAKTTRSIILLKGSDTVVAAPDGTTVVSTNAPPTLATAGSGDVLVGLIAGLMAQGMLPFMAAVAGTWLHAETARKFGFCLTPEDIISNLNQTLNGLFRVEAESA